MIKDTFSNKQKRLKRAVAYLSLVLLTLTSISTLICGCAGMPPAQPQVDALVISRQYAQALALLTDDRKTYGSRNTLLFLMDKGFIEHLSGDYRRSIATFALAQDKFDELYTHSLSKIAATWVINDNAAPYHGEDFERVTINIFQALNYILLGEYQEAMVEARDVDSKLNAINAQYGADQKNVYKEDAFARLLTGIMYEAGGSRRDLNDAFIAYRNALNTYENDYHANYGSAVPALLRENLLTSAREMGIAEYSRYRDQFKETALIDLADKKKQAEVYIIHYNGLSPVKTEESLTFPTLDGQILKIAFPVYRKRPYAIAASRVLAKNAGGQIFKADSELCQDLGAIAVKNLDNRKLRFIAKSAAKAAGRFLFEKKQKETIEKNSGGTAAGWFQFFANIYNLVAEQADLRSWQTLPDQIRAARLLIPAGEYEFTMETFSSSGEHLGEIKLKQVKLEAGQKIFLPVHTSR